MLPNVCGSVELRVFAITPVSHTRVLCLCKCVRCVKDEHWQYRVQPMITRTGDDQNKMHNLASHASIAPCTFTITSIIYYNIITTMFATRRLVKTITRIIVQHRRTQTIRGVQEIHTATVSTSVPGRWWKGGEKTTLTVEANGTYCHSSNRRSARARV